MNYYSVLRSVFVWRAVNVSGSLPKKKIHVVSKQQSAGGTAASLQEGRELLTKSFDWTDTGDDGLLSVCVCVSFRD